jgi:hypothetical protein
MKTRHGDGIEALSQETERNGSVTPTSRRHPLTLPPDRLRRGYARALRQPSFWFVEGVLPGSAAGEAERSALMTMKVVSTGRSGAGVGNFILRR